MSPACYITVLKLQSNGVYTWELKTGIIFDTLLCLDPHVRQWIVLNKINAQRCVFDRYYRCKV